LFLISRHVDHCKYLFTNDLILVHYKSELEEDNKVEEEKEEEEK
jgi:hypothetical protein